jgi:tetratricopeptide (TPR) repeat protein/DNA-binding SARP family transcriptional activator
MLGPVELRHNDTNHDLGHRKERCLLAVLLWELDHPVAAETVVDHVWGNDRPAKPLNSLYSNVSRLRSRLQRISGDNRDWVPGSGWYRLNVKPENVDLYQFRGLHETARDAMAAGDEARAFTLLQKAATLWHGIPLAGLSGAWAEGVRVTLDDEHYEATLLRIEAGLKLGRHASLIGELAELTVRYPLRVDPSRLLMHALYRSGRAADALHVYPEFHRGYVNEMGGNESSAELRRLHELMLRNDTELTAMPLAGPVPSDAPLLETLPETLPASTMPRDNPDFTGRAAELTRLDGWLNSEQAQSSVPVVLISGMPGIGKTALAVHATRIFGDQYREQFFVELRSPDGTAVDPVAALGTLLRALGVAERVIPASAEDRVTLWRSRLAGKRALVVLDDAADSAQLRLLLPGAPGCAVLITTRRKSIDLPGMRWMALEPLPPADAVGLFTRTAGEGRQDDEAGVSAVLRLCGNVPQEVQFAARELQRHPAWSIEELRVRLLQSPVGHRELGAGLDLTYRHLMPDAQRLLRRLALDPAPRFSRDAAAALAGGQSLSDIHHALDTLTDYNLIEEAATGCYVFHDVVREYARRLAEDQDSAADREHAIDRLLDYYLDLADRADRLMHPFHRRIPVTVGYAPANSPPWQTRADCRQQMEAERPSLLAITRYAAAHGRPEQAGLLAHVLARFLDTWGCWVDAGELHRLAIAAWRTTGNISGEAKALTELSLVLGRIGHYEEAFQRAGDALTIAREARDRAAEADALDRMGISLWWLARYPQARERLDEALSIWRALGDHDGEADSLMYSGIVAWHLSLYPDAVRRIEQSLALYRQVGDMQGEANALNNLGELQQEANKTSQALDSYQRALDMYKDLGDRQGEAIAVNNIGNVYRVTGRNEDAVACFRAALDIYRDIGDLRCEADTLNNTGAAYLRMGRHGDALDQHHKALVLAHQLAERYLVAESLKGSGGAHLAAASYSSAADDFLTVIEVSREIGDRSQEAEALAGLGDAQLYLKGRDAARAYWFNALTIFEDIGKPTATDAIRTRLRMGTN